MQKNFEGPYNLECAIYKGLELFLICKVWNIAPIVVLPKRPSMTQYYQYDEPKQLIKGWHWDSDAKNLQLMLLPIPRFQIRIFPHFTTILQTLQMISELWGSVL